MLESSRQIYQEVMCNTHSMFGIKVCCNCTLVECLSRCAHNITSCEGVDYDVIHRSCFYHDAYGLCFKPRLKLGVYQVRKISCSKSGWSQIPTERNLRLHSCHFRGKRIGQNIHLPKGIGKIPSSEYC